jgi:hypothetical protein
VHVTGSKQPASSQELYDTMEVPTNAEPDRLQVAVARPGITAKPIAQPVTPPFPPAEKYLGNAQPRVRQPRINISSAAGNAMTRSDPGQQVDGAPLSQAWTTERVPRDNAD